MYHKNILQFKFEGQAKFRMKKRVDFAQERSNIKSLREVDISGNPHFLRIMEKLGVKKAVVANKVTN